MSSFFEHDFRTEEADVVEDWLRTNYGSFHIQDSRVSYAEQGAGDQDFSLNRIRAASRFTLSASLDKFLVVSATPGYRWEIGDRRGEFSVDPAVLQPGDPFRGVIDDVIIDFVAFDPDALDRLARTHYGDDDVRARFASPLPISPRLRDQWRCTLRWAMTQVPLLSNELVRAGVVRAVSLATLEAFALEGDRRERRASAIEQSAIYHAAMTYIDEHVSLPITVEDAATAVGTSTAGLRRAFAAHASLADSPEEYLRLARLSAVHADLVDADPGTAGVEEIARRWGFGDTAVFRARYRGEYGVSPETTLGR